MSTPEPYANNLLLSPVSIPGPRGFRGRPWGGNAPGTSFKVTHAAPRGRPGAVQPRAPEISSGLPRGTTAVESNNRRALFGAFRPAAPELAPRLPRGTAGTIWRSVTVESTGTHALFGAFGSAAPELGPFMFRGNIGTPQSSLPASSTGQPRLGRTRPSLPKSSLGGGAGDISKSFGTSRERLPHNLGTATGSLAVSLQSLMPSQCEVDHE